MYRAASAAKLTKSKFDKPMDFAEQLALAPERRCCKGRGGDKIRWWEFPTLAKPTNTTDKRPAARDAENTSPGNERSGECKPVIFWRQAELPTCL